MQCKSNGFISIVFLVFKDIDKRNGFTWTWFLEQTDKMFKNIGLNTSLAANELPFDISSEGMNFPTKTLSHKSNLFLNKENLFGNYRNYSVSEKGDCAIFTCCSFSISVTHFQ